MLPINSTDLNLLWFSKNTWTTLTFFHLSCSIMIWYCDDILGYIFGLLLFRTQWLTEWYNMFQQEKKKKNPFFPLLFTRFTLHLDKTLKFQWQTPLFMWRPSRWKQSVIYLFCHISKHFLSCSLLSSQHVSFWKLSVLSLSTLPIYASLSAALMENLSCLHTVWSSCI